MQRQKLVGIGSADRSALDWPRISVYAYQCPIRSRMTSQAYQWGETARSAQQRDDRAPARITKPAKQSAVATIRNNQRPCHWKRHNCRRRYTLKYLHLALNSRQQLTPNSRQQLTRNSRAHIGSNSRAHIVAHSMAHLVRNSRAHLAAHGRQFSNAGTVSVSCCHRITPVSVGNRVRRFGSPNCGGITPVGEQNWHATSRLHLRSPPVGYI